MSRAVSAALCVAAATGACSSLLDIRPLATGRADVSAFELTGADLPALQREARRLCPQGGEILRQAGRSQVPDQIDGRTQHWLNVSSEWLDPPQRVAQLVVLCHESPGSQWLAAAAAPAVGASGPADAAAAAAPVGPLNPEW